MKLTFAGGIDEVAREYDHEPALLDATAAVNERQRRRVIAKLQRGLAPT